MIWLLSGSIRTCLVSFDTLAEQFDTSGHIVSVQDVSDTQFVFADAGCCIEALSRSVHNDEFMANVMKIAMGRLCCPTLEMVGATAMYKLDPSFLQHM